MDRRRATRMPPTEPDLAGPGRTSGADISRQDRLKAALKANIARRKAQARARTDAQDTRQPGPGSADVAEDARLAKDIDRGASGATNGGGTGQTRTGGCRPVRKDAGG